MCFFNENDFGVPIILSIFLGYFVFKTLRSWLFDSSISRWSFSRGQAQVTRWQPDTTDMWILQTYPGFLRFWGKFQPLKFGFGGNSCNVAVSHWNSWRSWMKEENPISVSHWNQVKYSLNFGYPPGNQHIPTLGKGKSSTQKCWLGRRYVSS